MTVRVPRTSGRRVGSVRVSTDRGQRSAVVHPNGQVTVELPSRPHRHHAHHDHLDPRQGPRRPGRPQRGPARRAPDLPPPRRPPAHRRRGRTRLAGPRPPGPVQLGATRRRRAGPNDPPRQGRQGADRGRRDRCARTRARPAPGRHGDPRGPRPPPSGRRPRAPSTAQPALGPAAALDRDPATAWVSDTETRTPTLRLLWRGDVPVASPPST